MISLKVMDTPLVVSAEMQGLSISTLTSLRAVEVLAFGPMRSTEVAHHLRIHPRTARRILAYLAEHEWVRRIPGRWPEWELTARVLALASRAAHGTLREQTAIGLVDDLCAETACPAYAVVPCYDAVCCVADSRFDTMLERGDVVPAVENVGGHALMAYRPRWCEQNLTLAGATPESWSTRLDMIRTRGYAIDYVPPSARTSSTRIELAFPVAWRDDPAVAAVVVGNVPETELEGTVERVFAALDRAGRPAATPARELAASA